jgi:hypothetical protein
MVGLLRLRGIGMGYHLTDHVEHPDLNPGSGSGVSLSLSRAVDYTT